MRDASTASRARRSSTMRSSNAFSRRTACSGTRHIFGVTGTWRVRACADASLSIGGSVSRIRRRHIITAPCFSKSRRRRRPGPTTCSSTNIVWQDRKNDGEGKGGSVRVDPGSRRIIKKKKKRESRSDERKGVKDEKQK